MAGRSEKGFRKSWLKDLHATLTNEPQIGFLNRASPGYSQVVQRCQRKNGSSSPQIAIPVTYDQPGVAARIADKKTGKTTSLDGLDASNLSGLLDEVLNNPIYRDNSRSIQKAIAKRNGLSVAAKLLEQAFGSTKKTQGFLQKTA
jgi:hypothetical protein